MALRKGIVVATHPEDHSVDLVMTDDYSRLAGVQVMTSNGNGASGSNDLYAPDEKSGADKWNITKVTTDNPIAFVDFTAGGMPVVTGFQYPQVGQMTFKEKNLRVNRHPSDVYSTLNAAGDFELSFPNGTFLRVGASPDHVDLTGQDVDGKWKADKNADAASHIRLVLGNAGAVKADLHIDPDGNVTGTFQGTGNLTFIGDLTVNAPNATVNTQTATMNASTKVELATPLVHCTQALTVEGLITGKGGMAISGGSGATVNGSLAATGGTFTHNGKNVGSTHTHTGVQPGGGTSGSPT